MPRLLRTLQCLPCYWKEKSKSFQWPMRPSMIARLLLCPQVSQVLSLPPSPLLQTQRPCSWRSPLLSSFWTTLPPDNWLVPSPTALLKCQLLNKVFPEPPLCKPPYPDSSSSLTYVFLHSTHYHPTCYIFLLICPVHQLPSLTKMQGPWAQRFLSASLVLRTVPAA